MDTMQLKLFVSAANTLNFSRTAEQFFISQPAVTHSVKILEASLGVKLFNRTSRRITLTAEGVEFLPYAVRALETLGSAEVRLQNMAQGRTGHIRIAALSSLIYHLSDCLVALHKQYPAIQVDIDLLEGTELVNSVRKGSYDFYFSNAEMLAGATSYTFTNIGHGQVELFVNKAVADKVDMNDWSTLKDYPLVSISRSDAWLTGRISRICKNRGFQPNIINYYNRAEAAIMSVNAGIGVAILPKATYRLYLLPDVVTFPIDGDDAKIDNVFAWKHEQSTTACHIFRDVVIEALTSGK
ncbi:MAG: LysR family transcriptional regulator [Oscillospiraceae bacterium]|nr:LysR family transcriptional regulator [Oscillospiraceae bacterium]